MNRIKTVGSVFALALIVLITVQYGLISSNLSYTKTMQEVHKNSQKINQLYVVFGLLLDMETSTRGFILTGEDLFLNPYNEAQRKLPIEMDRLDNFLSIEEFNNLTSSIKKRAAYADSLIAKKKIGQKITFYDLAIGKGLMDDIRMEVTRLTPRDENMVKGESGFIKDSSQFVMNLMIGGALLFLLVDVPAAPFVCK